MHTYAHSKIPANDETDDENQEQEFDYQKLANEYKKIIKWYERVIKALKTQYRKLQLLQMLQNIDNGEDTKRLSVLDAILMISEVGENVKQTTISNCVRHASFEDLCGLQARMIQSPTDEDDNVPLAQLGAHLRRSTATEPRFEFEEFIGIDDNVAVCALATEEEILAEVESNNRNTDEENEDQQDDQEQFQPTIGEALNAIIVLQKFVAFNYQFNTDDTLTTMKRKMQNIFEIQLKKQTKMTWYFKI